MTEAEAQRNAEMVIGLGAYPSSRLRFAGGILEQQWQNGTRFVWLRVPDSTARPNNEVPSEILDAAMKVASWMQDRRDRLGSNSAVVTLCGLRLL